MVYDPYGYSTDAIGIGRSPSVGLDSVDLDGVQSDTQTNPARAVTPSSAGSSSTAIDAAETSNAVKAVNTDWVRDLGAPWGLGSVVYRGEEKLSGYNFIEGTHIFTAKAYIVSPDRTEVETEVFLVPTGCAGHYTIGNTIRRRLLSQLDEAAHLVDPSGFSGAEAARFNLITDIPVLDLDYSEKLLDDLDKLIAAQGRTKGTKKLPIVMVARWTREQETENRKIEEEKIRKALAARQRSNVTWVSAGQLSPLCNIPLAYCAALNNSTTVSVPRRRQE